MKQLILAIFIAAGLVACTNYGKKVSQDYLEVYYKDGATKEEAQKTLDFLYPLWKEADGKTDKKSIQLTKSGDTINFRMVVDKAKLAQVDDETFYTMSNLFSDTLYNGAPVNMVFSDNSFKPIRTLVFKKIKAENEFGSKATAGNIEVYCKDGFSLEHAQMLADYLQKEVNPSEIISFQAGKTDDGGYLVRMVANKEKAGELGDASFNKMASELSTNVFSGGQVTFELTDVKFNPYKQYVVPMQ
jgi:hypothetical protein